jgi:hypothetical protein
MPPSAALQCSVSTWFAFAALQIVSDVFDLPSYQVAASTAPCDGKICHKAAN